MTSKTMLKTLAKARRVGVGEISGACVQDRFAKRVGKLDDKTITTLLRFHGSNTGRNDMALTWAQRTVAGLTSGTRQDLSQVYQQVDLQRTRDGAVSNDPQDYLEAQPGFGLPAVVKQLCECIGDVRRLRLSELSAGGKLDWHIDPPEQKRFVCLISGEQIFEFRRGAQLFPIAMELGEIWRVNTSFQHRVINPGRQVRVALLGNLAEGAI